MTYNRMTIPFLTIFCCLLGGIAAAGIAGAPLSFAARVKAQEAVERVYYAHRIWPKDNPDPKPPFETMVPRSVLEARVEDYLKKSAALEKFWQRPLTAAQLQAEMDRMVANSKDPAMLKELFSALNNDPSLIAECLARPLLADRLITHWYQEDPRFHPAPARPSSGGPGDADPSFSLWWEKAQSDLPAALPSFEHGGVTLSLPDLRTSASCTGWVASNLAFPEKRTRHTAVWTGTEMIIWGGSIGTVSRNDGAKYNPATDTWTLTSTGTDCPSARRNHAAVWTGTYMIVWGGGSTGAGYFTTGGRYNPVTNIWKPMTTDSSPAGRENPATVWTGTQMIVWGGSGAYGNYVTGGRYDPASDAWLSTSTGTDCPAARRGHTAVWTGSVMIVWGGYDLENNSLNSGGRYDPSGDTWSATSTTDGCPAGSGVHAAVWTGSLMVVWGGTSTLCAGRYDPVTNTWQPVSAGSNSPAMRSSPSAAWTGSEMIVWGGEDGYGVYADGGGYNPQTDTWTSLSTGANCPAGRSGHTAVWTGTEMIVWGGLDSFALTYYRSGGRYNPLSDSWVPTYDGGGSPSGAYKTPAVWTGTEMIVWGMGSFVSTGTGGRYNPATDAWAATSTGTNCPFARTDHSMVWTGTEMIVWGGQGSSYYADGGRYNPVSDTWTATATGGNCPAARDSHTAVWTGVKMIVWGGRNTSGTLNSGGLYNPSGNTWATINAVGPLYSTNESAAVWTGTEMIVWGGGASPCGGRYNPTQDAWTSLSIANQPECRYNPTAVWTGSEMIVWGGYAAGMKNTGGRYDPALDTWTAASTGTGCPQGRDFHTAVWTGMEMIVWGGRDDTYTPLGNGGRYEPLTDGWKPTSEGPFVPASRNSHSAVWTGSAMIIWGGGQAGGGIYEPEVTPSIAGPAEACAGSTVQFATEPYDSFQWSRNGQEIPGALSRTLSASLSGSYTVRAGTASGCSGTSEPHTLAFHDLPVPSVSGPSSGCLCSGVDLTTQGYASCQWIKDGTDIPQATGATYHAASSGAYSVRAVDANGCAGISAAVQVTLLPSPTPMVSGDGWGCSNPGVLLSTGSFASYHWNLEGTPISGATSRQYTATTTGNYSVTVTDATGCPGTSAASYVNVIPMPTPAVWSGSSPACMSAHLYTNDYHTYQWYRNGSIIYGATREDYSAVAPGNYTVRVTDWYGCSALSPAFVIGTYPAPVISGGSSGCGMVQLTTGSFASYQWKLGGIPIPGAVAQTFWATQSGTYTVQVTNGFGCPGTSAGKPVQIIRPAIQGDNYNTCPDTGAALSTGAAVTYQWYYNGNPIAGAAGASYTATVAGDYAVQTLSATGCTSTSDTHTVFVDYCSGLSEVSPARGIFPLRVLKDAGSPTGYYLTIQRLDSLDGFNIYEGALGSWYSHGNAPGNACGAVFVDLMNGEMSTELVPSGGSHYYLVTAYDAYGEGPSGFASSGLEIAGSQSTCAP